MGGDMVWPALAAVIPLTALGAVVSLCRGQESNVYRQWHGRKRRRGRSGGGGRSRHGHMQQEEGTARVGGAEETAS